MKKCYIESMEKGTSYIQYKEGELIPLVASCIWTLLLKHAIEWKNEGKRRSGRRCEHILGDLEKKRGN